MYPSLTLSPHHAQSPSLRLRHRSRPKPLPFFSLLPTLPRVLLLSSFLSFASAADSTTQAQAQATSEDVSSINLDEMAAGVGADGGFGILGYVWAGYCICFALPLLLAGVKLRKITCGAGLGLMLGLSVWVSFTNSLPPAPPSQSPLIFSLYTLLPTILLSLIAFALGFTFRGLRYIGAALICCCGGVALVLHVMLFKEGWWVPIEWVVWLLCILGGVGGLLGGVVWMREGVIIASSLSGGFLLSLGVDLIVNKEMGMSYGLRTILDGNSSHSSVIIRTAYSPSLCTQIILASGLGFALISSILQHYLYKGPFIPRPLSKEWESLLEPSPSFLANDDRDANRFSKAPVVYAPDVEASQVVRKANGGIVKPWELMAEAAVAEGRGQKRGSDGLKVFGVVQHQQHRQQYTTMVLPRRAGPISPSFFDPSSPFMRPPTALRPLVLPPSSLTTRPSLNRGSFPRGSQQQPPPEVQPNLFDPNSPAPFTQNLTSPLFSPSHAHRNRQRISNNPSTTPTRENISSYYFSTHEEASIPRRLPIASASSSQLDEAGVTRQNSAASAYSAASVYSRVSRYTPGGLYGAVQAMREDREPAATTVKRFDPSWQRRF